MSDRLKEIVKEFEATTQCQCDLDKWQPESDTGHSFVCPIHKKAKAKEYNER